MTLDSERTKSNQPERSGYSSFLRLVVFLVPFVYFALTSPSVTNRWFGVDDAWQLSYVRNASHLRMIFGSDGFHLFRPVKNWLFLLFSCLEAIGLEWCHLVSICLGAVSFFPVYALARRVFHSEQKAFAMAVIWLFSPTLVSTVAWLSCTNIIVMVMFAAMSIATHDSAWDNGSFRLKRVLLAGLCLFVSLVSYECAVALVPILLLFDMLLRPGRLQTKRGRLVHVWYFSIFALYMFFRHFASSRTMAVGAGSWAAASRHQLVEASPFFTMQHITSWFWPFNRFTVLGSYRWGDVSIMILAFCCICMTGIILLALFFWRRQPIISFGILFALLGFAPTSNCLGFGNGPYGDYYLSLASIGISVACVESACLLFRTTGLLRIPALVVVIVFAVSRIAAVTEVARWARLWTDTNLATKESINNFPHFLSNKIVYVRVLAEHDRYEEALALGMAIEKETGPDSPKMANVYLVRALYAMNSLLSAGDALEMLDCCERVASFGAGFSRNLLHYYRGCVFEDLETNEAEAKTEYEIALQGNWGVDLVPCADRLARIKAIQGERDEAISLWERAMKIDPDNSAVLWNLSTAYREAGDEARSNELREKVRRMSEKAMLP